MPAAKKPPAGPAHKVAHAKRGSLKPGVTVTSGTKLTVELEVNAGLERVSKHIVKGAGGGKYVVFTSPLKPRHVSDENIAKAIAELP